MNELSHSELAFFLGVAIAFGPGVLVLIAMVIHDAIRDWRQIGGKFKARDAYHENKPKRPIIIDYYSQKQPDDTFAALVKANVTLSAASKGDLK